MRSRLCVSLGLSRFFQPLQQRDRMAQSMLRRASAKHNSGITGPTLLGRRMFRADGELFRQDFFDAVGALETTRNASAQHISESTSSGAANAFTIPDCLQIHMRRLRDRGPVPDVTVAWRGEPAPDKVVRAARLMKAHRVEFNVLAAVHAGNADRSLDVYHFLRDEVGARFIQLAPVVDHVVARPVSAEQWGRFLIAMFDEWVRYDVGRVFVRVFDAVLLSWWRGQTPLHARRGISDLNDGYTALFDHVTHRWSRHAVSRL